MRHEAGEALAAIGDPSVIDVLEKYVDDEEREVAETCQLALKKLQWLQTKEKNGEEYSAYNSIGNVLYFFRNNFSKFCLFRSSASRRGREKCD